MKRTPELRTLSEDHHHGLVHARRLRRVAEGDEPYPAEARDFLDFWQDTSTNDTPKNITKNPAFDTDPAWSPTGNKIAFESDRDGGYDDIFVMNTDGSRQKNRTNNDAADVAPDRQPIAP